MYGSWLGNRHPLVGALIKCGVGAAFASDLASCCIERQSPKHQVRNLLHALKQPGNQVRSHNKPYLSLPELHYGRVMMTLSTD
jgi:hypothetical protein